ncbi:copper homeostasis protein CutC [Solihabitans fulvus]|uniref:Copper homeostasis protein cutC homolog n=1 Tax=Solihabitans fulvus TaxID=1892852 RepID=A0A5B2XI89_9PSEU|nr:copper homeostasis protein CutC [Solihabitans fulvus]KAA2262442.1 copper homeostasis protein CutC [Solihabitans fulvus]
MAAPSLLEIIALDAADAEAAAAGGADRLELVADIASDGLSPTEATVRAVLAATDLPVRVMLRDGAGFAPRDLDGLRGTAATLRAAGATEFVLGFLTGTAEVDAAACHAVLAELAGCRWTFHRALDHSADPEAAWAAVAGLGCDTVLTAGSARGVAHGLPVLGRLAARQAEDGLALLAGGGLALDHVAPLGRAGVRGFHVGGAVRPEGWAGPVAVEAVRIWADAVRQAADAEAVSTG